MAEDLGQPLDWDDDGVSDEGGFVVLPEGTYPFVVAGLERKRFEGSAKMAPCPMAELKLSVITDSGAETITTRLMLSTKTAWRVAQFFKAIGYEKDPETGKVPMRWNEIEGKEGMLKLSVRKYEHDGKEREANDVEKFLMRSEWPQEQQAQPSAGYAI